MIDPNIQKLPSISESLHNYTKSEHLGFEKMGEVATDDGYPIDDYQIDRDFWEHINKSVKEGNYQWGTRFHFYEAIVSEWIPRIPGSFWTKKSEALRELANKEIIETIDDIIVYTPVGKSEKVMGGLGTFKCVPQQDYRLVSLSMSGNCSAGIPLLVSNEVWERNEMKEGSVLHNVDVKWVKMEVNWSSKFMSSIDLVRGCLVLTDIDHLKVDNNYKKKGKDINPTAHPYTIFEYYKNGIPYYDFMLVTINKHWDKAKMTAFLNQYKTANNRNGRYIFEPDPNEIIYGAEYFSPSHYLQNGKDDIKIIETRIEEILSEESSGGFASIYNFLMDEISNENMLVSISKQDVIGIPPIQWRGHLTLLDSIKSFLDLVISQKKMTSLYDLLQTEYPQTFIQIDT